MHDHFESNAKMFICTIVPEKECRENKLFLKKERARESKKERK